MEAIEFVAQVAKIQTLVDGGLRITLDTGEGSILPAAHLMECKRQGVAGKVTFEPILIDQEDERETATIGRTKAKRRIAEGGSGV